MNLWLNTLGAGLAAAVVLPAIAETPAQPQQPQPPAMETPEARGYMPPPFPRHRPRPRPHRGMHIERDVNETGYELRIFTGQESPSSVQVEVQGNSILISRSQSEQSEQSDDRGSYSFSRSFNNFRRRISLPRDADAENMQRVDGDELITITLPRQTGLDSPWGGSGEGRAYDRGGHPGYGPGYGGPGYDPGFAPSTPERYFDESRYGYGPGYPPGHPYGYGPPPAPAGSAPFAPDTSVSQPPASAEAPPANPEPVAPSASPGPAAPPVNPGPGTPPANPEPAAPATQ